jgi:hypothetical protein
MKIRSLLLTTHNENKSNFQQSLRGVERVDKQAMANDNSITVPHHLATMIKWLNSSSSVGANPATTTCHEEVTACSHAGPAIIKMPSQSSGAKAEQEEPASSMVLQTKKRKEPSPPTASYSSPLTTNRSTTTGTPLLLGGAPRPLLDVPIASIFTATSQTGGVSFLADYLSGRTGGRFTPAIPHAAGKTCKRLRSGSLSELSSDDETMKRPAPFQHHSPLRLHTLEDSLKVMMASNNSCNSSSSSINSNLQLLFGDGCHIGGQHSGGWMTTTTAAPRPPGKH